MYSRQKYGLFDEEVHEFIPCYLFLPSFEILRGYFLILYVLHYPTLLYVTEDSPLSI